MTLKGTGYIRVRREVEYWKHAGATEDLSVDHSDTFKLVAGGGGFQYADTPAPFCNNLTILLEFATTPRVALMMATLGLPIRLITGITSITGSMGKLLFQLWKQLACTMLLLRQLTMLQILSDINDAGTGHNHVGASYDPTYGKCPCAS
ncbi:uncharacterized protein N7473_001767 [Penicillium subrubescens]|uniref:uncharacterized protein n=1 Tax=Penicillium subrubescens TaxID=1316194 RepID=UPI002545A94E|nr:uncharacterized protein N7473_001767 [Penicillium subrubescens]KAJ5904851.1 hypothetical protein N7473_001767 [Penicillium subrubescens]